MKGRFLAIFEERPKKVIFFKFSNQAKMSLLKRNVQIPPPLSTLNMVKVNHGLDSNLPIKKLQDVQQEHEGAILGCQDK